MNNELIIRAVNSEDSKIISKLVDNNWGGEPLVVRGKNYYPTLLPGLLAIKNEVVQGFLMYEMRGDVCEIIVFEIFDKFKGLGTKILNELKRILLQQNCSKIFLMTTNDDLDALRFYQRRGFIITGIHLNSIEKSRKMKPAIPLTGDYNIPIRDEIDLELYFK